MKIYKTKNGDIIIDGGGTVIDGKFLPMVDESLSSVNVRFQNFYNSSRQIPTMTFVKEENDIL